MTKITYERLSVEVEKLYSKEFPDETPANVIEDHCEYIATFIESCGWSTEEYMHEFITRGLEEYFGDPKSN